jgi:hypothetical protein
MPNQDALGWLPASGTGSAVLLALADGHGSPRHFRSQEGARLAVEAAHEVATPFLSQPTLPSPISDLRDRVERQLPEALHRRWMERVQEHLREHPITESERDTLKQKAGREASRTIESAPLVPYGSTVLVVVVTDGFIIYLQLGDGDLLTISSTGSIARPLPEDSRLLGNETTSLASSPDRSLFRVALQVPDDASPALILACTDGYANSYPDVPDPVAEFGSGVWQLLRTHGGDRVRASLPRWLTEISEQGSGDDITVGILWRLVR